MRISIFIKFISGLTGGAERVACDLASVLVQKGYQVEIVHFDGTDEAPDFFLDGRVKYLDIRNGYWYLLPGLMWWFKNYLRAAFDGDKAARRWYWRHGRYLASVRNYYYKEIKINQRITVIPFMPAAFTIVQHAVESFSGIRVVTSNHSVPEMDYIASVQNDPDPYDQYMRLKAASNADCNIVLLPRYKKFFTDRGINNVSVIPNFVQRPRESSPTRPACYSFGRKYLLYVGRFVQLKNMDKVILAFSKLADTNHNWNLCLAGTGPEWDYCDELVRTLGLPERIHLVGKVKDIEKYYAHSDILVMPSEFEGFPMAVLEAFSHGLPVVGYSDCHGIADVVENGVDGLLAESRSLEVLAEVLQRLMSDDELRGSMSKQAIIKVENYFPEYVVEKWESVIKQCC